MNTEAKVTNIQEDDMLNIDDLVLEIGKLHVEKMSIDKAIKNIKSKQQPTKKMIENEVLQKSNIQYQENNRKLDQQLVETRNKLDKANSIIKTLSEDITSLKKENKLLINKQKVITKPKRTPRTKVVKKKTV